MRRPYDGGVDRNVRRRRRRAPPRRLRPLLCGFAFVRARRLDESAPVLDDVRRSAVNLQPRHRFTERTAVHQRPLGARREVHVHQPLLQREDLPQAFDVAARQRQHPDRQARLFLAVVVRAPGTGSRLRSE